MSARRSAKASVTTAEVEPAPELFVKYARRLARELREHELALTLCARGRERHRSHPKLAAEKKAILASMLEHLPPEEQEDLYLRLRERLLDNSQWRGHPSRILRMFSKYAENVPASAISDKRVLDFGCGSDNPLHFAVLLFINGASAVTALDLKLPADEKKLAFRLNHLLDEIGQTPEDFAFWDNGREDMLHRLSRFDRRALRDGDWRSCIGAVPIRYVVNDPRPYRESVGVVDLCLSYTVLEHVMPFREHMEELVAALSEGGMMCHFVDFADHDRKRIKDATGPWNMFIRRGTRGGRISNQIRFGEMLTILAELGLNPRLVKPSIASLPAGLRGMLLEEYQDMSEEDLRTTSAIMLLEK